MQTFKSALHCAEYYKLVLNTSVKRNVLSCFGQVVAHKNVHFIINVITKYRSRGLCDHGRRFEIKNSLFTAAKGFQKNCNVGKTKRPPHTAQMRKLDIKLLVDGHCKHRAPPT